MEKDYNRDTLVILISLAVLIIITIAIVLILPHGYLSNRSSAVGFSGAPYYQDPYYNQSLISISGVQEPPFIELVNSYRRERRRYSSSIDDDDYRLDIEDDNDDEDDNDNDDNEDDNNGGGNNDGNETPMCSSNATFLATPSNFKVAFIGDSGHWNNFHSVLELIRDEGADLVLHQGDLGYDEGNEETPQLWLDNIQEVLDPTSSGGVFPYFFSIGNHDESRWLDENGYRDILQDRLDAFGIDYVGEFSYLGGKTSFSYNNLSILLLGPGIDEEIAGEDHELFIEDQLENSPYLWNICTWHKNMRAMQTGGKGDETGWGVYESCREVGAIIATAHEHSYSRTHVLSDMSEQIIVDATDPLFIKQGQTFVFVSGLGGSSIRDQNDELASQPYFASIYTADQDANYGALFIEFNVDDEPRKARGYFKDIDGVIADEFELYNDRGSVECEDEEFNGTNDSLEGFVYADGDTLMLDGEEFRFIGVNVYGLANDEEIYTCGPAADHGEHPNAYLDALFSYLSDHGVNAIRFWAFQSYTDGGTDFSAIDRVINYAREYNVKLIPVLENQWDHCPGSIHKYSDWYEDGYLEPYGGYSLSFVEYVDIIVNRYKDEPAILMWQLMNEAESETPDEDEDPESLYNFAVYMSEYIHSIDENHLVSLGTLGTGQPGTANEHFVNLHSIDTIDVVEAHDYRDEDESWPGGSNSIASDFEVAQDLEKPFFIGEAGISVSSSGYSREERAELFDDKISEAFSMGVDGYLIWIWENTPENYGRSCGGYCFTEGDPLVDVIEEHS